jgi:O-antigen ligase
MAYQPRTVPAPFGAGPGRDVSAVAGPIVLVGGLLAAAPVAIGISVAPRLTVIGLGALAVVTIAVLRLDLALLLLIGTIPLEAAVQPSGSALTISKVAGALCFASFLLHFLIRRRELRFDQSHAVVFGLLLVALFSSLQATDIPQALTTTLRYGSFALLYFMLTQIAPEPGFKRRAAWVLSVTAAISAVLGLQRYFAGEDYFATLPYENQNDFAFILVTTIPLAGWLLVTSTWIKRVLLVGMIGVMLLAVVLSFSRGAIVGFGAAVVLALFSERRRALLAVGVVLLALVAVWAILEADPDRVQESYTVKERVATSNIDSRLDAWVAALTLSADHPALGVGPGNFGNHFFEATGRTPGTENLFVVHNAYLDVMTEVGVIAFFLFLAYLALVYGRVRACERGGVGPPGYAFALRLCLFTALVSALFLSEQYFGPFWVIGALCTALWLERNDRPALPSPA